MTGGTGGSSMVGCGFGEPNDVREMAKVLTLPDGAGPRTAAVQGICVGMNDVDFYQITAPVAPAGGVMTVDINNVSSEGTVEMVVTAADDNGEVFSTYTADQGASLSGWFAVASGATYRIKVDRFAGSNFTHDLSLTYTPIVDMYEPNNTRADAKPIVVGTPIQASAGVVTPKSDSVAADEQDWYKVTLAAGGATVRMSNVPADYRCEVATYNSAGAQLETNYTTTMGANCELSLPPSTPAGEVTIKVQAFAGAGPTGAGGAVPPRYTAQYTLAVTQP
jgi:hypothetical protein